VSSTYLPDSPHSFLRIEAENPLVGHNYTEIRSQALHHLLEESNQLHHHAEAMEVYTSTRDLISHHLYDDVLPCFRWLVHEEEIPIAILTNSQVQIPKTTEDEFGSLVSLVMNASEMGCSKPSLVAYLSVTQRMNVHPSRVLFIGDDYQCDVLGPSQLRMQTAHLCRHIVNEDKMSTLSYSDQEVRPDLVLRSLDLHELRDKIFQKYLTSHGSS
jgi:FMN phosphatase YigB (HAD superfamily)